MSLAGEATDLNSRQFSLDIFHGVARVGFGQLRAGPVRIEELVVEVQPLSVPFDLFALKESLPKSLGDTPVNLPFDNGLVQDIADVVNGGVVGDIDRTRFRIDFNLTNVAAVGETHLLRGESRHGIEFAAGAFGQFK